MTTSPTTTGRAERNAESVGAIYAAFGRGDVPAILARLSPDVAWDHWADNFAQRGGVPHLVARSGRDDVAGFFAQLAGMTVLDFAVRDVIAGDRQVVADVRAAFALPNGGRFADEELHLWSFDDEGQVVRFRHYCDTAKHLAASAGSDTVAS